jgi:WD40 repeat protein
MLRADLSQGAVRTAKAGMATKAFPKLLAIALVWATIPLGARAQEKAPTYSLVVQMSHGGYISKILFDPPRRQMATASNSGEIKIWDLFRRQEVWTFKDKLGITAIGFGAIAFNADGSDLAVAGDNGVISIIDLKTGNSEPLTIPFEVVSSIVFNAAGDKLAVGGANGRIDIAFLSPEPKVETVYEPPLPSKEEIRNSVVFTPSV